MRKKYKNEIFNILNASKLGIEKFDLTEPDDRATIIKIIETPFQFTFRQEPNSFENFDCCYTKYLPSYPISEWSSGYKPFGNMIFHFNTWLSGDVNSFYEDEYDIDLWNNYKSGQKLLNIEKIDFDDKAMFSLDERKQISLAIRDLKLLISSKFNLNEGQIATVNARLDYLTESSERTNKFDWKSILISTIISITIALSLDTEKGHELYLLFKQVFSVIPQILLNPPI